MTIDPVDVLTKLVSFDTRNEGPTQKPSKECPEFINDLLKKFGYQTELLESDGYYTALAEEVKADTRFSSLPILM